MSHAVQINYKQISVQCHSICEVAQSQLCELDKLLKQLEQSASRLLNDQTEALHREIEQERAKLTDAIQNLLAEADEDAKKGIVTADADRIFTKNVIDQSNRLKNQAIELASKKLPQMRALLDTLLKNSIETARESLEKRADGITTVDKATQRLLDSIENTVQRQFTYLAFLKDNTLSGDELIRAGLDEMNTTVESRMEREAEQIRAELKASGISKETVEKIVGSSTLSRMREEATDEIVGEKIRQKSLRIIRKAIMERGFIVDKKNIKINREKNEVIMIGMKASGEKATFKVYLDGRFIYDFRGYEGQACQKDIEPFMKALEEVYGMNLTDRQEIWKNPDKLAAMKYQAMNTNHNKG